MQIMKIYKPRGVTTSQLLLVTTLGVLGGVYIWKPLFEDLYPRKKKVDSADIELIVTEQEVKTK